MHSLNRIAAAAEKVFAITPPESLSRKTLSNYRWATRKTLQMLRESKIYKMGPSNYQVAVTNISHRLPRSCSEIATYALKHVFKALEDKTVVPTIPNSNTSVMGRVFEDALEAKMRTLWNRGGRFQIQRNVKLGTRIDGKPHEVDFLISRDSVRIAVSSKWQSRQGTAAQKIAWEKDNLLWLLREQLDVTAAVILYGGNEMTRQIADILRYNPNYFDGLHIMREDEFFDHLINGTLWLL